MRYAGLLTVTCALAMLSGLLENRIAHAQTLVISDATVYTRPDEKLEHATVVVSNGVIQAVGPGVQAPAGARMIDGRGKVVTAGFIEPLTQVGLVNVELEPAAVDGRFAPDGVHDVHAAFRTRDAYDGRTVGVPVARSGGVTSVVSAPLGGLFSGQSAFYPLADTALPVPPVRDPAAMHASLGAGATGSGSRGLAIELMREVLSDAVAFGKNRAAYERNQQRAYRAARLDLEALQAVLKGQIPLVVSVDGEPDIRAALAIAREFRLRLVIAGGAEAFRASAALAEAKVPVILDPTRNLPLDMATLDVRDDTATLLAKAGVPVAISTLGNGSAARTVRQLAGIAVSQGLPWSTALAALTTVPAQIYGVRDRGTVTRGAVADIVVWSGDPLELSSRAELVIVGGVEQSRDSHQTRLFERYRTLK
jgi:imidazolonepropionase-like amidohydrolase